MSFGDAIKTVFSNYATFSGRARRSEFWWWFLFITIINAVMQAIWMATLPSVFSTENFSMLLTGELTWAYYLWMLVSLALLLPSLGVTWRRLHDTNRSGGFYFLALIPLVGPIILLVFLVQDTIPGDNRFGASPK